MIVCGGLRATIKTKPPTIERPLPRKEGTMSNESFSSVIVAFILIASVIIYLDLSGGEYLIALIAVILSIIRFAPRSDDLSEE